MDDMGDLVAEAEEAKKATENIVWLVDVAPLLDLTSSKVLVRLGRKYGIPMMRRRKPGDGLSNSGWAVSRDGAKRIIRLFYGDESE